VATVLTGDTLLGQDPLEDCHHAVADSQWRSFWSSHKGLASFFLSFFLLISWGLTSLFLSLLSLLSPSSLLLPMHLLDEMDEMDGLINFTCGVAAVVVHD
jgi:hypothetical protein